MKTGSSILALLTAAILALTLACNGDGGPAGTPLPSGRTPAPTPGEGAGDMTELAAQFLAGVEGKHEYFLTGPLGGFTEAGLTIYRLGVNDRQDWVTTNLGFEATTATILGDEKNYTCSLAPGLNTCREAAVPEIEALRIFTTPIYQTLIALVTEPSNFEVSEVSPETWGGVTGACYQATSPEVIGDGPPATEEIKACFRDDGLLLYLERTTTPQSPAIDTTVYTMELKATSVVQPQDFEPTGPVQ